jgi:hypothetical protein
MKMEKWDLLKLLQEWGEGDKGEWWRGWIHYIFYKCHNVPPEQQLRKSKEIPIL